MSGHYDVMIVGGGPTGLCMATALAQEGCTVAVIERQSANELAKPAYDGREIALTHRSRRMMEQMGAWQLIPEKEVHIIRDAKVLDGNSPYSLNFDHAQSGRDYLSYIMSNHIIRKAAWQVAKKEKNITLLTEAEVTAAGSDEEQAWVKLKGGRELTANLLIAADSRFSATRRMMGLAAAMYDFGRVCVVCRMEHSETHDETAYECFHYDRTLALLPLSAHSTSVVITLDAEEADEVTSSSVKDFERDMEDRTGHRLGSMKLVSERYAYPLVAVYARRFVGPRFALAGDAAVGMHPVTAHGFNFGLRSIETLTSLIRLAKTKNEEIASPTLLRRYEQIHRRTTRPLYLATNGLVKLYTDTSLPARLARRALLHAGNLARPVRAMLMQRLGA